MVDFKITHQKQDQKSDLTTTGFSRSSSLPNRDSKVELFGEEISGPVLRLGANPSSGLSGRHQDIESQAISNRLPYQSKDSDSVARTIVISGSRVSFSPDLN